MTTVISVENLSKSYQLGQIGTGTFAHDLNVWWAKLHGKPNPMLRIGETEHGNRDGEEIWALKDVSFTVEQGEVLGIIGRNGAGKSTLLKILSRVTAPTSGRIKVKGRVASLLEVGTGFHPELTGRENVYLNGAILGMSRKEIDRKFDEIVDFSGVEKFIDTPVKRYSSGMYVRLAFAVAAHLDPEILVVDEVLAVGDAEFQKKCLGKMGDVAQEGRTVLYVSHNMESVLNLCSRALVADHGQIVFAGVVEDAVRSYLASYSLCYSDNIAHILYRDNTTDDVETRVFLIEVLNSMGDPKPMMYTWDTVLFRVHYRSRRKIRAGTFVLDIWDYKQQRLIVFDSGQKLNIHAGEHWVDCIIPKLPLAAGEYYLGAGLAVSRMSWLWRKTFLTQFVVHGKDVFDLGRPPVFERMILAVEHQWRSQNMSG